MKRRDLQDHLIGSYTAMRLGIALLGIALPITLWLAGWSLFGLELQGSMSAYYHAGDGVLRNVFVGVLCAVGAALFFYQGYTRQENVALDIGGVALWGVAFIPMEWECTVDCGGFSWHAASAFVFFFAIAYVCIRRATDTLKLIEEAREDGLARARAYRRTYRTIGLAMIASPIVASLVATLMDPGTPKRYLVFWAEALGVFVFSAYWIFKSLEIRETHADRLAAEGLLVAAPAGIDKLLQPMPVSMRDLRGLEGGEPEAVGAVAQGVTAAE